MPQSWSQPAQEIRYAGSISQVTRLWPLTAEIFQFSGAFSSESGRERGLIRCWVARELYLKHFLSATGWSCRSSAITSLQWKDKLHYPPPALVTHPIAWIYPTDGVQPHAAPSAAITMHIYSMPQCKHAPWHGQWAVSVLISCKIVYNQQLQVHCLYSQSRIGTFLLYLIPPMLLHLPLG